MIKLIDTKNEIVDSISLSYEDSFTLDSFQDMIQSSHEADKSFILARVSTADPKQPNKCFYSYYNAYQLNKVLFQTQIIKGKKYIHRLHVLNPLSNLDIVGDVLYFHVKPLKTKIKEEEKKDGDQKEEIVPSESAMKSDAKSLAQWTLAGPISSPLTEEFPEDEIKPSANRALTYPVVRPLQMVQLKENITIDMFDVNAPHMISPQKLQALSISMQERKVSIIPKGVLTRFNTPISDKPPSLKRGNRRALSWMNTNNCLKKQLSFEEWKTVAKKYKNANVEDDFDKVENITEDPEPSTYADAEMEYNAILFATDNDFLESAKTRTFFRTNALSADENKLFEMPTVEDQANMRTRQSTDEIRDRLNSEYIIVRDLSFLNRSGRVMVLSYLKAMSSCKFEKVASLDKSILTANPELELHRNKSKIHLRTPDAKLLKCFDWIKSNDQEMIALGYSSGRVLLGQVLEEQLKFITEFVPKHSRSCIDVSFCPTNSNLLATALDKVRNDCGLNVWDIERCTIEDDFSISQYDASTSSLLSNNNEKPRASYGSSEGISSMAWFHNSAKIIAGMSQKWIRLFDLRDNMSSSLIFSTRAVQGITTDPFSANRWASFSDDGIVRIFDVRKVGEPVLSFSTDFKNGIKQINWAKSRSGIIGVIGRDSPIIRIFEIQDVSHSADAYTEENDSAEGDVPILTSLRQAVVKNEKFSCFTWDTDFDQGTSNLLLFGEYLTKIPMPETLPSVISPIGHVGMTVQGKFLETKIPSLNDISVKMFQRSIKGYNLNTERNLEILDDENGSLRRLWAWIHNLQKNSHMFVNGSKDYAREGLYSLVESSVREAEESFSKTIDSKAKNFPFNSYNSPMRRKALLMIGWEFYTEDLVGCNKLIEDRINASLDAGNYEEAAAVSFFHALDLQKTISALIKSPEERLKLISISLASLEISKSSAAWKNLCGSVSSEIKSPFLRSIFGLIASSGDVYAILNDKEFSLRDKLGIAFRLLNDQMLLEYLSKLMTKMMLVGEVQSIILYGLSESSLSVLSNYLDYSGDIQTVALLSSFIHAPANQSQIRNWILSYRELLDRWRHFDRRAEFDIYRSKFNSHVTERDPGRLSLRCNYCSGPVAVSSNTTTDLSNCQKCRKPLPRCSICLINMGIPINESKEPISDWFTFCISCKHGGHVSHIKQWFNLHDECPIWNCSCRCGG